MELVLLSVFGVASLIVLEFWGLFYKHGVRDPHLIGSELHAGPSAHQHALPVANQFLSCSAAANDAETTTIVCVRARRAHHESVGE